MSIVSRFSPSTPSFGIDHSVPLLRHGYRFWDTMRRRTHSEIVHARLLRERVTALRGPDAAQFFYTQTHVERAGALPTALAGPLFGSDPVHMLDGEDHEHRKAMFNDLLDPEAAGTITSTLVRRWDERSARWNGSIDIFDEVGRMLMESGCEWAGIPIHEDEISIRTRDMLAMVDGFGAPTARNFRARQARRRTEAWIVRLIACSRTSRQPSAVPLDVVAHHRDRSGDLLPAHTAAVEVINLIRPLVAISWLTSGLFEAYDSVPQCRTDVLARRVSAMDMAQEVRRTYPFVPFLATRTLEDLWWEDAIIPSGTLLVLDVWGTNHDPRTWVDPDSFDPGRFQRTPVTPYNLIPQGGGFRAGGHRCPGEDITLAVLIVLAHRVAELPFSLVGPRAGLRRMPPRARCIVSVER